MRQVGIVIAIVAVMGAVGVAAQRRSSPPITGADDMMSNVTIPGFDAEAGLRAAQASNDPAKRVEVLRRPGITTLERVAGQHRARAILKVERLPQGLDPEKWPVTALVGDYGSPSPNYIVATVELRVDGCAIAMPVPRMTGFTDPRSVELGRSGSLWTLTISNNGDSEAYTVVYRFDDQTIVFYRIDWGGSSTEARLKIDEDNDGAGRDCVRLGKRTAGTRAELAAAGRR